jgi:CoA:oxalate CoA-transferase
MTGPLHGIRVLDLTQVLFGPFTTMLLSDMGAEVIKVERPGTGDIARDNGPFTNGVSTYFLSLNRGKKSLTLDLSNKSGLGLFFKLIERVDVLVETFNPKTLEELGIGYSEVIKYNPNIIYAAGSGFGLDAPDRYKPAFDITIQAISGVMSITGEENGPPVRPGLSYGDISAALYMCIAILAALRERHESGKGQLIDISMLDCQATMLENAFVRYFNTGEIPKRLGARHPLITPFQLFQTKDSHIAIALRGDIKNQWPLLCSAIGRIDLIDDERFTDGWQRTLNYEILEPILNTAMKAKKTGEWLKDLEQLGIPCGPLNSIPDAAEDKNLLYRNMFVNVEDSEGRILKVVNSPFKFSRTPSGAEQTAPDLGEHTEFVLNQLIGISKNEISKLREEKVI